MTLIANALPPSTGAAASLETGLQPVQTATKPAVEAPAVIVSIGTAAAGGSETRLQYAIAGVDGAILNYNNGDYARIAARDGADAAAKEKASLLQAAESEESYLVAYAGQHGLSTGSTIAFDAIKADPQADSGSALQAAPAAGAEAPGVALVAPSSAPLSAAAADADVALATLTSPPTPAKPASIPPAIGSRVSTSL